MMKQLHTDLFYRKLNLSM